MDLWWSMHLRRFDLEQLFPLPEAEPGVGPPSAPTAGIYRGRPVDLDHHGHPHAVALVAGVGNRMPVAVATGNATIEADTDTGPGELSPGLPEHCPPSQSSGGFHNLTRTTKGGINRNKPTVQPLGLAHDKFK